MAFTKEMVEELDLLALFDLENSQAGLKVHHDASAAAQAAAGRLHAKGLIDKQDGGYLTNLGLDAAEHAQVLLGILRS
ncbi:TIGR02647 family protein [Pseudomonas sp. CAN2814]|jgi:uncharacterized protein (TIGR02647 family)|uniref:TIGR02647 family protein n=1 Tax=Pseudomonas sp. CAN1 TaxID=3046726 RepID=UPI0026483317|nr:TIGR02647 family protein [Pseudomonas sp. CAN1]MDN6856591.1 TIGR02647 family protein [Pseudomonas sp. CAN1]